MATNYGSIVHQPKAPAKDTRFKPGNPYAFKPGVKPDVEKSPLHYKVISEALRDALAAGDAKLLADRWIALAKDGPPNIQLAALIAISDRIEGKAMQAVAVQHSIDDRTMQRYAELFERLHPVLEGECK